MDIFTKEELKELLWCIDNSTLKLKYAKVRDSVKKKVSYLLNKQE